MDIVIFRLGWYHVAMEYQGYNKSHIHVIARALMVSGDNLIFCHSRGKDWLFLPGGHVEDGEGSAQALARELREELGPGDYPVGPLLGVSENVFSPQEGFLQHEINFVFRIDMPEGFVPTCQEKHIEYVLVPKSDLPKNRILPPEYQVVIPSWLAGEGFRFFGLTV